MRRRSRSQGALQEALHAAVQDWERASDKAAKQGVQTLRQAAQGQRVMQAALRPIHAEDALMLTFLAGVVVGAFLVIGLAVVLLVWAAAEAEKAEREIGEL